MVKTLNVRPLVKTGEGQRELNKSHLIPLIVYAVHTKHGIDGTNDYMVCAARKPSKILGELTDVVAVTDWDATNFEQSVMSNYAGETGYQSPLSRRSSRLFA